MLAHQQVWSVSKYLRRSAATKLEGHQSEPPATAVSTPRCYLMALGCLERYLKLWSRSKMSGCSARCSTAPDCSTRQPPRDYRPAYRRSRTQRSARSRLRRRTLRNSLPRRVVCGRDALDHEPLPTALQAQSQAASHARWQRTHRSAPPCPHPVRARRDQTPSTSLRDAARRARSVAIALKSWLFTVPIVIPSASAISASVSCS